MFIFTTRKVEKANKQAYKSCKEEYFGNIIKNVILANFYKNIAVCRSCARKIVVTSKSTFFGEKWQLQAKKKLGEELG